MLYEAAFNREPDKPGLGFWIGASDKGVSVQEIARHFMQASEFMSIYGSSPTNKELVTLLYKHILDREPDPIGLEYWIKVLDSKLIDQADALYLIAMGYENEAQVVGKLDYGIEFVPYG